jgi:hypothetical protein
MLSEFNKIFLRIYNNALDSFIWQIPMGNLETTAIICSTSRLACKIGDPTSMARVVRLSYTVVFRSNRQSRVTHPPVDIEIWQGSRVTRLFVEPPERHTGLKIACKTQKSQNFRKFGCCRNVELVFWVTHHTQCRFERNTTVCVSPSSLRCIEMHCEVSKLRIQQVLSE